MISSTRRFLIAWTVGLALIHVGIQTALAEIVRGISDGQKLNAEFLPGDIQKPAVLVLHGFLQTREFLTTQSILSNLSRLGYTVLGPNLSLGVSDRLQSMQCQAPHQHRFDDDVREIDFWIQWLRAKGHARVILIGHSWGSQHSLGYVEAHVAAPIAAVIGISLVRTEQANTIRHQQMNQARARDGKHDTSLQPYALSFCHKFMATPESYLSYASWDDARVIQSLKQLSGLHVPVHVILGSKDKRSDEAWVALLRQHAKQLTVVDGANHFFSSMQEFDLNDQIEKILETIKPLADEK